MTFMTILTATAAASVAIANEVSFAYLSSLPNSAAALSRLYARVVGAAAEGVEALYKACAAMAVVLRLLAAPAECTRKLCAEAAKFKGTLRLSLQKDSRPVKAPA